MGIDWFTGTHRDESHQYREVVKVNAFVEQGLLAYYEARKKLTEDTIHKIDGDLLKKDFRRELEFKEHRPFEWTGAYSNGIKYLVMLYFAEPFSTKVDGLARLHVRHGLTRDIAVSKSHVDAIKSVVENALA